MRLSQAKIDLVVLYALHQRLEAALGATIACTIASKFKDLGLDIGEPRIQLALEQLSNRGEADFTKDWSLDRNNWKITRKGVLTIEDAIGASDSFISKLNLNGYAWLLSTEAKAHELKKLPKYNSSSVQTDNGMTAKNGFNWTKWGVILTGIGIVVAIIIAVVQHALSH